jgi:NADH-quinone oxidoreductase subunit G
MYHSADYPSLETKTQLSRVGEIPIYAQDSILRRAHPLQDAQAAMEGDVGELRLHPDTLTQYALQTGDRVRVHQAHHNAIMIAHADERVAKEAVWAAGAISATLGLGGLFDAIHLEKA